MHKRKRPNWWCLTVLLFVFFCFFFLKEQKLFFYFTLCIRSYILYHHSHFPFSNIVQFDYIKFIVNISHIVSVGLAILQCWLFRFTLSCTTILHVENTLAKIFLVKQNDLKTHGDGSHCWVFNLHNKPWNTSIITPVSHTIMMPVMTNDPDISLHFHNKLKLNFHSV